MELLKKIRNHYFEEVTEDNETEKIKIRKKFLRFFGTIMLLFFTLLFSFYLFCLLQTTSNNQ
jgi:hypothetical protein